MAIILRGASTTVRSTAGTTMVMNTPAGVVAGDLILIWCFAAAAETFSDTTDNFTAVTAGGTGVTVQLLWKTAGASEPSTYTVTATGSHPTGAVIAAYGNVAGFDPAPAAGSSATNVSTITAPSITTVNAGDLLIWAGSTVQASATGAPTVTVPTGYTPQVTQANSGPGTSTDYVSFIYGDKAGAAAGATGTVVGNATASELDTMAVLIALQPAASSADPSRALPSPAWRGQFSRFAAKEQPSVLYDFYLQFSGAFVSAGDIAFGAVTLGSAQIFGPPQRALPSPAFRGQFGRYSAEEQPAILYDVWLQFSGSYLTAGDIAFGANTSGNTGAPTLTDPQRALPGPAFRGQFTKSVAKEQPAVLYDVRPQFSGAYSSAGDIAFSAVTTGNVQIIGPPQSFEPSPVWRNIFQINDRSKESVLYDVWLQFSSATSGTITFGAITVGSVTATAINDPQSAFPGPAWLNQFRGSLGKSAILWDSQPPVLGLFCFTGSTEIDPNASLGGTAILASLDATDGGSVNDNNQLAGTILDANGGLGGTATDVAVNYGGSETDANLYGGFLFGGCYD